MDLVEYLIDSHQLWDQIENSIEDTLNISEIWAEPGAGRQSAVSSQLNPSGLNPWLDSASTKVVTENESHRRLFRIVWIERSAERMKMAVSHGQLKRITQSFGLDKAKGYSSTAFAGVVCFPESSNNLRSYALYTHPKLTLLWSHDPAAVLTSAICIARPAQVRALKALVEVRWQLAQEPMMIAMLCSIMLGREIDLNQTELKREVREIETRTGYHRWKAHVERPATGDLSSLTANLSGCAMRIASVSRKSQLMQELHDFVLDMRQLPLPDEDSGVSKFASDEAYRKLRENINFLQRRLKFQLMGTEFIKRRIEQQLDALVHITSQKDALMNLQVARDSKLLAVASQRDSSSMRTLAVVTMLFLPGTFVAAMLSMPAFNSNSTNENGEQISVNPLDYGIFWAVTVPLTLLTLLVWRCWLVWERAQHEKQNSEARSTLYQELGPLTEVEALVVRRTTTMLGSDYI